LVSLYPIALLAALAIEDFPVFLPEGLAASAFFLITSSKVYLNQSLTTY
jgi:hypothetical protein